MAQIHIHMLEPQRYHRPIPCAGQHEERKQRLVAPLEVIAARHGLKCMRGLLHDGISNIGLGVRAREEPVLPSDPHRTRSTLGWIIIDGHATVLEEQGEARHPAETKAKGLGQIDRNPSPGNNYAVSTI